MISCAANSGPLSVVIDLTGRPLSRMSRTTAYGQWNGLFSRIEFLHEHKAALPFNQSNDGSEDHIV